MKESLQVKIDRSDDNVEFLEIYSDGDSDLFLQLFLDIIKNYQRQLRECRIEAHWSTVEAEKRSEDPAPAHPTR